MPPVHAKKPCSDCMFADGGKCEKHYAEGGNVFDTKHREDNEKGVHKSLYSDAGGSGMRGGISVTGDQARWHQASKQSGMKYEGHKEKAKAAHHKVLGEIRSTKGPTSGRSGFADGGDVDAEALQDPMQPAVGDPREKEDYGDDGDMSDMIADELMQAFEKKDKQGVKDAIEALVMECMNKGEK